MVRRHPLPEGVPDEVMNKEALALAFNTSLNTIDKWLTAGMPVLERGKNGQAYELQLSQCWAWKQARDDDSAKRSAAMNMAAQAMRLALVGGESGESIDALTPKQKREVIETQMAYEAFQKSRNELISRKDVTDLCEEIFSLIRDVLNAMPDRLEREADLDARAVERSIAICDDTMADASRRIREFFNARPVTTGRQRKDLLDA